MNPELGTVIVLTGPPGSGKTTAAPLVADHFPQSAHVVADHFWEFIRQGWIEPWLPESARQNDVVIAALAAAVGRYASGGYTVVIDGIVGPWYIDAFADAARSDGLQLHYVILRPARDVALTRATNRSEGHLPEAEPVEKMYTAFEALGSFESHVLDNGRMDAGATAGAIVTGIREGRFRLA